jgi:prevent-host-death family protein
VERINFARDIQPLSAFRKQASALIDRLQKSRRPLVLTRNGRSAVVVLDVGEFERMVERIEILEDVQTAREQAHRGETIPQDEALAYLSGRLGARGDEVNETDGNAESA